MLDNKVNSSVMPTRSELDASVDLLDLKNSFYTLKIKQ